MHLHLTTTATTDTWDAIAASPALRLNTAPDTNRVNPAELRHLRRVVAATAICCLPTAVQTEVTRAYAEGMILIEEARVLLAEAGYPTGLVAGPMTIAR